MDIVITKRDLADVAFVRNALCQILDACHVSTAVGCTAMTSLILDTFVDEIAGGNREVGLDMRRLAERLQQLADATPENVRALALHLADYVEGQARQ